MKVQEAINKINSNEYFSLGDVTDEVFGYSPIKDTMEPVVHRWYLESTDIYECEDGFVGVRGLQEYFPEDGYYDNADVLAEAFEVQEVPSVSYQKVIKF